MRVGSTRASVQLSLSPVRSTNGLRRGEGALVRALVLVYPRRPLSATGIRQLNAFFLTAGFFLPGLPITIFLPCVLFAFRLFCLFSFFGLGTLPVFVALTIHQFDKRPKNVRFREHPYNPLLLIQHRESSDPELRLPLGRCGH